MAKRWFSMPESLMSF